MIYLDTSVVLAQLLAEDRRPPASFWGEPLTSSRLLEYEIWNRIHSRKLTRSHAEAARQLLARMNFLELSPLVLARDLEPLPMSVRTLDALHLASVAFLVSRHLDVRLATYDGRMATAADRLGIPLFDLGGAV